jgi:hypothetical protein
MSKPCPASSGIRSAADDATSEIPDDFQLRLTEAASQYLNSRWRVELSSLKSKDNKEMKLAEKPQPIKFSDIMGDEMLEELRSIALCLAKAAVTTCKLDTPFI